MKQRTITWLIAFFLLGVVLAAAGLPIATATAGSVLSTSRQVEMFVDVNNPSCDDANPGTPELPLCTIQEAADRSAPGTIIHVREGVYYEQVDIRNSGTATDPIAFVTDNDERVVIDSPGEACFDLRGVEYIKIHGFELTGAWMPPASTEPPASDDSEIKPHHGGGIRAFPPDEDGYGVRYSLFTDNIIHDNGAGVWLVYSHYNVISNNIIYSNGEASIRIKRGDYNRIYNNLVFQNGLAEHWGITFYCATGTVVQHNTVVEAIGGAFFIYEGTSNLNGAKPGGDGYCQPSSGTQVFDNIGVVLGLAEARSAPMVIGSSTTTDRDPLIETLYGPLNNWYHHNLWFNKRYNENVVSWGDLAERGVWEFYEMLTLVEFQQKFPGYGADSLVTNPLFVNPAKYDFRLSPGSPAKGAASDGLDLGVIFEYLPSVNYISQPQSPDDSWNDPHSSTSLIQRKETTP